MIALVTCLAMPRPDEDEPVVAAALAARGIETELVAWDDPAVDWSRYEHTVIRSTWNYVHAHERFLAWTRARPNLSNTARTVAWNSDKAYLVRFAEAGVPVVPTIVVPRGSTVASPWPEVVVKPRISAGSFETYRFGVEQLPGAITRCAAERDVLVQPYIASVDTTGERSLVWIDGALTHAIRKSPRFARDRENVRPVEIADDERAFAHAVLAHVNEPLLYARIDLARAADGSPLLMELELIEPSLFLRHAPAALQRFTDALARL